MLTLATVREGCQSVSQSVSRLVGWWTGLCGRRRVAWWFLSAAWGPCCEGERNVCEGAGMWTGKECVFGGNFV